MNKNLLKLIAKYKILNEKLNEIIKYLYNHTELFEQKYTCDFPDELFNFFRGKITRHAKETNKLYELLSKKDIEKINEIILLESWN